MARVYVALILLATPARQTSAHAAALGSPWIASAHTCSLIPAEGSEVLVPKPGSWQFTTVNTGKWYDPLDFETVNYSVALRLQNDVAAAPVRLGKQWEAKLSSVFLRELQALRKSLKGRRPHLLDVGANFGWFSLLGAAAGAKVTAVEPNIQNAWLLKRSLCTNMFKRVRLHVVGAGESSGETCNIISPESNVGNTMLVCGGQANLEATLKRMNAISAKHAARLPAHITKNLTYAPRGMLRISRLDELVGSDEPVDVIKIDIEGFEPLAAKGWTGIFDRHLPKLVISEFKPKEVKSNGFDPAAYLNFFVARGYAIQSVSGKANVKEIGPLRTADDVKRWLHDERHLTFDLAMIRDTTSN